MKNVESVDLQEKVAMSKINKYLPHCDKDIVLIFQTLACVRLASGRSVCIYRVLLICMLCNIQLSSYPAKLFETVMIRYMSDVY